LRTITLRIDGSAGNQFFQYAFARNVQERLGGRLVIDYSYIHNTDTQWPGSDNMLQDFNVVDYEYALSNKKTDYFLVRCIKTFRHIFHYRNFEKRTYRLFLWCAKHLERFGVYYFDAAYYPYRYPKIIGDIVIEGYFECPKYFKEIDEKICRELTPKHPLLKQNIELYKVITERNSVCITIKRQDVENPDISEIYEYDMNYFYQAVNYIRERESNPVFVIFSDNVDWCRENFLLEGEVYYETPNNPIWEKVRLMSGCKHFIIHNSTFSWWVQHLSRREGTMVIAPVKWMLRDDQPIDIYEDNWIFMRNDGSVQPNHD
jgi:hypothetical protein